MFSINNEIFNISILDILKEESEDEKLQKERELQGTGAVLRIPLRALGEITIPVATLEKQKKIGKIYIERIKLQSKLNKYSDLIEQFTNSIIEEALKGDD